MKSFYVYMLKCSDDSYYIGHTDDIEKRLAEHKLGKGSGYTSKRLPVELVLLEEYQTRVEALEVEHKIKKWSRKKKNALINRDWESLSNLASRKKKDK